MVPKVTPGEWRFTLDFEESKRIIADCQQLFFMNENAPITLQTDASDYEIGGYLFQTVDGMVQVIMCISKVLEDMLKHVRFHLNTDHKNLAYINCAHTGKVAQ